MISGRRQTLFEVFPKPELSSGDPFIGGLAIPLGGFLVVLMNSEALIVTTSEPVLRFR